MKTHYICHLPKLLLAVLTSCLLAACGGNETNDTPREAATTGDTRTAPAEGDSEPSDVQPRLGMSTRQITKMYGEPSSVHHSSHGEVWKYWFNRGQMFIPYNFGYKPRMGSFTFNENGILTDFDYNE